MTFCPHCGAQSEGRFCPGCGYDMSQLVSHYTQPVIYQQPPSSPPPPIYPAQPPAYHQPPPYYPPPAGYHHLPPPPPPQKSSNAFMVFVVVFIVVFASVGVALVFLLGSGPSGSFTNAKEVKDGETVDSSFTKENDNYFYKIKLQPGDVMTASLKGSAEADFDLYIYESKGFSDQYLIAGNPNDTSTETATMVAWQSAFYIVDVFSYRGTGDYSLSVAINGTVSLDDGNNNLASATAKSLPINATAGVNKYYDTDDYYKVSMSLGEVLDAQLSVPLSCDFDLYILDSSGNTIGTSKNPYGDEEVRVEIPTTGYYYIDVSAYDGSGTYTLNAIGSASNPVDNDNRLATATQVLSGSKITSTLDRYLDRDDYYYANLNAGQRLNATLLGPSSADFDLWLFDSNGSLMKQFSSYSYGSIEYVDYVAGTAGKYYLNPYAYAGKGSYTLTVYISGEAMMPVPDAGPDQQVYSGQAIAFDGSGSRDDGPLGYQWSFGDGQTADGEFVNHTYASPGNYTVTLWVTDNQSNKASDFSLVEVFAPGSRPLKYAVVVGIADYQSSEVRDLDFSDDDGRSWGKFLESKGYTVHLLIDSQATEQAIMDEIAWMDSVESAGAYCAFTYSGHGGRDSHTRESYICSYEFDGYGAGEIDDSELGDAFKGFTTTHIFFFFDSCFSGGLDSVAGPGRYVSQTCSATTWGLDAPRYQRGLWTYWFLEWGLKTKGYEDLRTCYTNAVAKVRADPTADYGYENGVYLGRMTPEQEYTGSGPFTL